MTDLSTQAKLDKLDRIQAQNRARAKEFLDKKKASGKKQISGLITLDAYNEICKRRDTARATGTPLTMGDIISQAVMGSSGVDTRHSDIDDTLKDMDKTTEHFDRVHNVDSIVEHESIDVNINGDTGKDIKLGDYHGISLDVASKDKILIELSEALPGRDNAQARVDMLNGAGVTCGRSGAEWTVKNLADNLYLAKKRQGKK